MANNVQHGAPASGQQFPFPYLVAGLVGLTCIGLIGSNWRSEAPPPSSSLAQAVSSFDSGQLAPATMAFRTLAEKGNAEAAYWYGHALEQGLGVPADVNAAITQYEKASAAGVTAATTRLGELYLDGNFVAPDFTKARTDLSVAARQGDARGALDLGRMLRDGIGGTADPVSGYAWLEIAALRGNQQARVERDQLLPNLTPAQQAEATARVAVLQQPPKAAAPQPAAAPTSAPASKT